MSMCTVAVMMITVYLGLWQLSRYQEKMILQQAPNPMTEIQGYFVEDHSLLLDNQLYKGQVGYEVYSLFKPTNNEPYILVNRGWIKEKEILNKLDASFVDSRHPWRQSTKAGIQKIITITGKLKDPLKLLLLKPENYTNNKNQVVQQINIPKLAQAWNISILPQALELISPSPYHFQIREPSPAFPPSRHLGYALQWFSLALLAFIYFLIFNLKRNKKES